MVWRVVHSLEVLRGQFDAAYPGRSHASDGTIGDAAHQAGKSDHNPATYAALGSTPVVCALDITHDPARGVDTYAIAEVMRQARDPRVGYIISHRRITGPNHGWKWDDYSGDDPHDNHMHVSSVHTAAADDPRPWKISNDAHPLEVGMPFVALDEHTGQYYVCDLITSRPVDKAKVPDVLYLAKQLGYGHNPAGNDAEWTDAGWTRKGWSEPIFGTLQRVAASPTDTPTGPATEGGYVTGPALAGALQAAADYLHG